MMYVPMPSGATSPKKPNASDRIASAMADDDSGGDQIRLGLGGLGSVSGAFAAGLLLGLAESITTAYISVRWAEAVPTIEDRVDLGCNVCVAGPVTVGQALMPAGRRIRPPRTPM